MNALMKRLTACLIGMVGIVIVLSMSGTTPVLAQRFQNLHGDTCLEYGRFGWYPVTTGGYVAAGYSASPSGCMTTDIYVLRLNNLGGLMWSNTYDIGGGNDRAHCVIECANGDFAVVGYTDNPPGTVCNVGADIFLMRLNPVNGAVLLGWPQIYGAAGSLEEGFHVEETAFGNFITTFPGDFIISGSTSLNGGDAYLLRVSAIGALIWDGQYGGFGLDGFSDAVESAVGANAGDIIAAGISTSFNAGGIAQGLLVRVNGNTGAVGPAPQGAAVYGGIAAGSFTDFYSVQELQVGANAGNIVALGGTNVLPPVGGGSLEVYLLKTTANPTVPIIDQTYGDLALSTDEGSTVRELNPPAGVPTPFTAGNLAFTGHSNMRPGASFDGILLEVDQNTLAPTPAFAAGFWFYGQNSDEGFWGLTPVYNPGGGVAQPTNGYALCGGVLPSGLAPSLLAGADPGQLYFIKTNRAGSSGCNERRILPLRSAPAYIANLIAIAPLPVSLACNPPMTTTAQFWINQLCFFFPKEANAGASSETSISSAPNPVVRGASLQIKYTLAEAAEAHIVVTDINGRRVHEVRAGYPTGDSFMEIATDGWASGTYLVTVTVGEESQTQKIVVTD